MEIVKREAATEASYFAHATAAVSQGATIGEGTRIWQQCQIREGAVIGRNCILSKDVYVDAGVRIGDNVKIQNGVSVYHGVTLEDGVFCGPHCVFTNDSRPRAINADGTLKNAADWTVTPTLVRKGASIGANATIVCGVTIGAWAMIGAGAVVTHDVPDHGLVVGVPARLVGFVCPCGATVVPSRAVSPSGALLMICPDCHTEVDIPQADYIASRTFNDSHF
jgi:acetyltransferase-like isoleucine patch superfamily enzyme